MKDVGVEDELGTPAAEGDGFELGFEVLDEAGEGAADLVFGEDWRVVGGRRGEGGDIMAKRRRRSSWTLPFISLTGARASISAAGADVVRLVVDVEADVAVEILGGDFLDGTRRA